MAPFRNSSRDRRAGLQVRVLETALTPHPPNPQHPQLPDTPEESTRLPRPSQSIHEPPPVQCSAVPAAQCSSRSKVIDHCDSIATRDPCTDPHTLRGRHLSTVKGCHLTQGVWSQNTLLPHMHCLLCCLNCSALGHWVDFQHL